MLWMMVLVALATAVAAAPLDLAVNGQFADGLDPWNVTDDATCVPTLVPAEAGGAKRALQLKLAPTKADAWSIILRQPVDAAIPQGHHLRLSFWARSAEGCRITFYAEEAADPWPKFVAGDVRATGEWRQYQAEAVADKTYQPGGSGIVFHLGHGAGTLQITGIALLDLDETQPAAVAAGKAVPVVANGDFAAGADGWQAFGGDNLRQDLVDSGRADLGRALRLSVSPKAGGNAWDVQFGRPLTAAVTRGDALYARVWLRSPEKVRATFIIEQNTPPHTKSLTREVRLTPEWAEYRFMGRALASYAAGAASFKLFLGHDKGTVDIAQVRVDNHGAARGAKFDQTIDYWGGRPHDDAWRAAATARIEQIRRGDLTIRVVDAAGKPVPGAKVTLRQQRHAFRFGSAVPAGRLLDPSSDGQRFQQEVARLYNVVTFENDLKWHDTSPAEQERIDRAIAWCAQRGIDVRAHNLVWGSERFMPASTRGLETEALRAVVEKRVREHAARYVGRTYLWDVVNEAVTEHSLWDKLGQEEFAKVFTLAHEADPKARLCYNEYNLLNDRQAHWKRSLELARYLLDQGAPITTFGEQAHQGLPLQPMPRVLELLDEAAKLGLDIELTEFDLGGVEDDAVHGQYIKDFMTAVFSHPKVSAFILWGFWEGAHWRAGENAAMFRRDWTKKPAQEAWEDLVLRQWWSHFDGQSGADGTARTRVYYGNHAVTVEAGGKRAEATVERLAGGPDEVVVKLP
ncbi:MAG: endo-1,4-beta-xylanase [Armatimonadetes bacterium]|nr:endo-1,4-beta-xylanase [Armatimonadota bacterium]